jgi:AraC family transcriptional activator of pobA
MLKRREIRKYGLYGEGRGLGSPEFVHIEKVSTRSRLHNWIIAPHIHPNIFQLLYLYQGEGILAVDGAELELCPPALVIVPCGRVHAFRFKPRTEGWVLSIADSLVDDRRLAALEVGGIARGAEVIRIPLDDSQAQVRLLATLLTELAGRHNAAPGQLTTGVMAIIALILSLTVELSDATLEHEGEIVDRRTSLVRRFTRLADENLRRQWSVARYARELGTTVPTLTRACHEVKGMPPGQLILDQRLREAKRALSYTDASVGRISDDLGFSDPAYFARVFRRHTGMTASAYRRERFWPAAAGRPMRELSPA